MMKFRESICTTVSPTASSSIQQQAIRQSSRDLDPRRTTTSPQTSLYKISLRIRPDWLLTIVRDLWTTSEKSQTRPTIAVVRPTATGNLPSGPTTPTPCSDGSTKRAKSSPGMKPMLLPDTKGRSLGRGNEPNGSQKSMTNAGMGGRPAWEAQHASPSRDKRLERNFQGSGGIREQIFFSSYQDISRGFFCISTASFCFQT
jgi:hypothetical protein